VSIKWSVVGVMKGEGRNGRIAGVQVSISDGKPPHFSFGVGLVQPDGSFKPTAFLQDRDVEEYAALLITAKSAVMRAVVGEMLARLPDTLAAMVPEAPVPAPTETIAAPAAPVAPATPVLSKGLLRVTLGDQLRAKGGKLTTVEAT
jgi:hypothetical protein